MRWLLSPLMKAISIVLMIVGVALSAPRRIIQLILNADRYWFFYVYYQSVRLRRWTFDEPLWQEHDLKIHIPPPAGHPWWNEQERHGLIRVAGPDDLRPP